MDPQLIALLLASLGSPDAKGNMELSGVPETTAGQKRTTDWLFSPEYGMLTGGYDYQSAAAPPVSAPYIQSTPLLESYAASGDQWLTAVADGVASGVPLPKLKADLLAKAREANDDATIEYVTGIADELPELYKEQRADTDAMLKWQMENDKAQREWEADQPWAKAGLPNPTNAYEAVDMPGLDTSSYKQSGPTLQDMMAQADGMAADRRSAALAQRAQSKPTVVVGRDASGYPTARISSTVPDQATANELGGSRLGPEAGRRMGSWGAPSSGGTGPQPVQTPERFKEQLGKADDTYRNVRAARLAQRGRSPFQDALMARLLGGM